MLSVRNLRKVYRSKKAEEVVALDGVSIDFPETGFVFLLGKSGSGKSTLLNAIGGLDKFDSGEIIIKGKSSKDFSQSDFDSYRNTFIGFIFQEYNILENFSVAKNLALALELQGKKADHEEVMKLLSQVEMEKYAKRKPNELSGGQKQRVAIARALIKNPEIIMADEPTGALDSNTGKQVMDTLKELSKTKLIIVVSHDREFAEIYGDRIIELKDGRILQDVTKKEIVAQETKSGIKVIDNDIVYIKKGQQISDQEMKAIVNIINNKSQESDAFISFNGPANEKLKEGAKINDDGNKEKFLDTEKEDINVKQYNPNSLRLIKSRLGFMDSFKMGASALKNKVGKLIFTILLSFFAFTVFGIFDALSCWNRGESVYEAMKINKAKTVVLQAQNIDEEYGGWEDSLTYDSDLKQLQNKFKDRTIKGVAGSGYYIGNAKFGETSSFSISYSSDPLYSTNIGGLVNFTADELNKFGFKFYKGRLPEADDEIAISKYTMEALIKSTAGNQTAETKITEDNIIDRDLTTDEILRISLECFDLLPSDNGTAKVVGVIDDQVNYSKYKEMDSQKRMDDRWIIESFFSKSLMQMAYVTKARYDAVADEGVDTYINIETDNSSWGLNKDNLHSLETYLVYKNKDKDDRSWATYYSYQEGNTYYSLEHYEEGGYWRIYEVTFGENVTEDELWYYDISGNSLRDDYNQDANDDDARSEFESKFGIISNVTHIPSKFVPGYYNISSIVETQILYYKDGSMINNGKLVDIGENSIIIEKSMAESMMGSDYETIISEGVTVDLRIAGKKTTYNVVGVSKNGFFFSDKDMKENILTQFKGNKMIISHMTDDSSADESFVLFCEGGENGLRWTVQNSSTYILDRFEGIIDDAAKIIFYIAIGFAVFAALMLMNFISTSISYKKREIGVLRALGARGSDVFGIFFNESMIIAMINFFLSAVTTVAACLIINSALVTELGMDIVLLNVGIRQIILLLGVSALSAFVGSFLPTYKISRKRPIDAINNR